MDASQPRALKKAVQSAFAMEENRDTEGKFIQAPSFFVFLVIFSTRKNSLVGNRLSTRARTFSLSSV